MEAWRAVLRKGWVLCWFSLIAVYCFSPAQKVIAQDDPAYDIKKIKTLLQAIRDQEDLLTKYPDNEFTPTVMFQLSELYVKRAALKYQQSMAQYEAKLNKYDNGLIANEPPIPRINLSDAINMCYKLLDKYPRIKFRDQVLYRIALCHLEEGNKEKAKDYFVQLISETKDSKFIEEAYFRLGEFYFDQKLYSQAVASYKHLLNSWDSPYFNMALYKLGWTYYNMENYSDAISTFIYLIEDINLVEKADTEFLGKTKADLRKEAIEYVAICFAEFGGPEKARQFLTSHKEKDYASEALLALADIYQKRNFYNDAIETLNVLLDFYPYSGNAPKYQQQIIENYELAGDRQKANTARALLISKYGPGSPWLRQVADDSTRQKVLDTVAELLFTLGTDAQAEAQETKLKVHYQLAIDRYRSFLEKFPNSERTSKVLFYLAECLYNIAEYGQAADNYFAVIRDYPDSEFAELAAYHRVLAYDQMQQQSSKVEPIDFYLANFLGTQTVTTDTFKVKNPTQARLLAACNDFYFLFPNSSQSPEVLMKYGEILYHLEQYAKAKEVYKAVLNNPAQHHYLPQAYTMIAQSAFKEGQYSESEDWFARLIELYPDSAKYVEKANKMIASSRFKVAETYKEQGAMAQAAQEFEKIARISPDSAIAERAEFEAALQYENVGQKEKAISLYESLYKKFPNSNLTDEALFRAGILSEELEDWNRAALNYINLYRSNPASKFASKGLFNAAKCLENAGEYQSARDYYGEYVKMYQDDPDRLIEAAFRKGEIAYNQGPSSEAVSDFKSLVQLYNRLKSQGSEVGDYLPANAQFLIGEILFEQYRKIKLVPPLERNLTKKQEQFKEVINAYTEAARFKVADWATASSYKIGVTFEEFAKFFLESPAPDNLTSEQLQQYNTKLQEKVLPFKKKALATYQSNVQKAYENNIQNAWITQSRERMEALGREMNPPMSFDRSSGS